MSSESENTEPFEAIHCRLDIKEESGLAVAALEAVSNVDSADPVTVESITAQLHNAGIADWAIDSIAIEDVVKKFKKQRTVRILIAERKDASFSVTIRADNLAVSAHVTPAQGGRAVEIEELKAALSSKKVDSKRINAEALNDVCNATEETTIIVARGKAPVNGKDSQFVSLYKLPEKPEQPEEDDQGRIDFYAGREYTIVEVGTPLMERLPPRPGKVGLDVFGQIITASAGEEIPFGKDLVGTEFSSEDPNVLIASVTGHPVFAEDGARVDNTLQFENVGLETGHIRFDGSVNIAGDVMADIEIDVTGDVFIKGVVERATVKAGHDIHIAGGVLGDTTVAIEDGETLPEMQCHLDAGRNISARYVNVASLNAGRSIFLKEYAFHSKLKARDSILLGQKGGKGNLVGGENYAGHAIVAKVLGNTAYNQTTARVGVTRDELQEAQKLKFLREQRLTQARSLRKILDELKQQGETEKLGEIEIEKARKIYETLMSLQDDVNDIKKRLSAFEFAKYENDEPNITASSACYPNCEITINGAFIHTKQEHKAISFIKRGRKITAKS